MYFFQFSRNGRRDITTNRKKKRQWAKPNNSTMNRICKAFEDIGNINMNWAGVAAFNWQMLLSGPCPDNRYDIVDYFCELDNIKISFDIISAEETPDEKSVVDNGTILDEHIIYSLEQRFGSLAECYPFIAKYLFSSEEISKSSHKQSFWRIFGDIAIENLRNNLKSCSICTKCSAKIPSWADHHECPRNVQGFYECIDCGQICERKNARQLRCPSCQEHRRHDMKVLNRKERRKELTKQCSTFYLYRFKKM